ncbi:MAG: aldo/keto reductase, partial [Flavobacterium sp.]
AMQVEYSLVARSIEREHVPAAKDGGMAIVPWSPLAGGFLTGKYQRESTQSRGRLSGANPFGDSKFTEANWKILDVVERVAKEINAKPAQVALSWISQQAGVGSTIIGASKAPQLADALGSLEISLSAQQMKELSQVSALSPEFSDSLVSPMIRKIVYGGHDVQGWGEDKS